MKDSVTGLLKEIKIKEQLRNSNLVMITDYITRINQLNNYEKGELERLSMENNQLTAAINLMKEEASRLHFEDDFILLNKRRNELMNKNFERSADENTELAILNNEYNRMNLELFG